MKKLTILFVFFLFTMQVAFAQRAVTGKVVAVDGVPLPGVTVMVQGTITGTTTDVDGGFSVQVPNDQAVLRVSFIGFVTQELTVGTQSTINVTLSETAEQLSEVVVTALGIKREAKSLGYAVASVGSDVLTENRSTNAMQSLEGRVAGLVISSPAAGAGASTQIRLRGQTGFSGDNSPLIVINGLPMSQGSRGNDGPGRDGGDAMNNINPDDIEDMTILRGSTAAALYGSLAANGAILITTKAGSAGQAIGIEYSSTMQTQMIVDLFEYQQLFGQGSDGRRPEGIAIVRNTGAYAWGSPYDGKPYMIFDGTEVPYSYVGPRIKDYYRTGRALTNTVAVSGSTNSNGSFRVSYANTDTKGLEPDNEYKRNTLNGTINHHVVPKLLFTLNFNYTKESYINPPRVGGQSAGSMNFLTRMAPSIPLENFRNKESAYDPVTGTERVSSGWQGTLQNPYYARYAGYSNINDRDRLLSTITLRYDIIDGLFIQGRYNYDWSFSTTEEKVPGGIGQSNPKNSNGTYRGSYNNENRWSQGVNAEFLLGFDKRFGQFTTNANLGGSTRRNSEGGLEVDGSQFILRDVFTIVNATNKTPDNPHHSLSRVNSLYGTAEIGWNSMLYLNVTGRNDWFSRLANLNKNDQFYPSVSGSFVFSEVLKKSWLNYGKIRGSLTQVGSIGGIDNYYGITTYGLANNNFNGQPTGTLSGTVYNMDLKPYTVDEREIGLEMRMFKNRLYVDLAMYDKISKDQIMSVDISRASGTGSIQYNIGSIKNYGFESLIEYRLFDRKDFRWTTSWNNNFAESEVLSIGVDEAGNLIQYRQTADWSGGDTFIGMSYQVLGQRLNQVFVGTYMRDANGNIKVNNNGTLIGTYNNPDAPAEGNNGNGMYSVGSGMPKVTGGWNNSFSYKNFTASVFLDYRFGGVVVSGTNLNMTRQGFSKMSLVGRVDENGNPMVDKDGNAKHSLVVDGVYAYDGEHKNQDGVTVTHKAGDRNESVVTDLQTFYGDYRTRQIGDPFVYKSDYIKLRSISLSYNLTSAVSKSDLLKFVKGLTVSVAMRNVATLYKDIPNVDPEQIATTGNNRVGYEGGALPVTRDITFGLNVRF